MLKELILSGCLVCPSIIHHKQIEQVDMPTRLIAHISKTYKVHYSQVDKLIQNINPHISYSFPSRTDVLAIIAIESSFRHNAVSSSGAKGFMQILYRPTISEEDNIIAGVQLLKEYKARLGSEKAAIHAYNVGIGNYLKGVRNHKYYAKYAKVKNKLNTITEV